MLQTPESLSGQNQPPGTAAQYEAQQNSHRKKSIYWSFLPYITNLALIACFWVLEEFPAKLNLSALKLAPSILAFMSLGILEFLSYLAAYQKLRDKWRKSEMTSAQYYAEYFFTVFPSLMASIFAFTVAAKYPMVALGGGTEFIAALASIEAFAPWVFVSVFFLKFIWATKELAEKIRDENASRSQGILAGFKLFLAGTTFTCAALFLLNSTQINLGSLILSFASSGAFPIITSLLGVSLLIIVAVTWGSRDKTALAISLGISLPIVMLYLGFGLGAAFLVTNPLLLVAAITGLLVLSLVVKQYEDRQPPTQPAKPMENRAKDVNLVEEKNYKNEFTRDKKYSYISLGILAAAITANIGYQAIMDSGSILNPNQIVTVAGATTAAEVLGIMFACTWLAVAILELRRAASSIAEANAQGTTWFTFTILTKTLPAVVSSCVAFSCFAKVVPFLQQLAALSGFVGYVFPAVLFLSAFNELVNGIVVYSRADDKTLARKSYASSAMMFAAGIILAAAMFSNPASSMLAILWGITFTVLVVGKFAINKIIGDSNIPEPQARLSVGGGDGAGYDVAGEGNKFDTAATLMDPSGNLYATKASLPENINEPRASTTIVASGVGAGAKNPISPHSITDLNANEPETEANPQPNPGARANGLFSHRQSQTPPDATASSKDADTLTPAPL